VLALALAVALRWSEEAREAIALVSGGATQTEAARTLGVTRQAVGQRLGAALFRQHVDAVAAVVHLLEQADAACGPTASSATAATRTVVTPVGPGAPRRAG
jgi:hypothetical protein